MLFFIILLILHLPTHPEQDELTHTIYVAGVSWHTVIIVPGYAFPDSIWAETNYSVYEYLEIGWGDRDFFQNEDFNLWFAAKAACWPTATALHLLPLPAKNIERNYVKTKVVALEVSTENLEALIHYLLSNFERDGNGKVISLGPGLYGNSRFFAGSTKYYFPKNSNVWAARALKHAGFSFKPIFYQTTDMVTDRAAEFGVVLLDR